MKRILSLVLVFAVLLSVVPVMARALNILNENYWTEEEAAATGLAVFTDREHYALQSGEKAVYLFGLKNAAGEEIYPATLVEAEACPGSDYLIVYDKANYAFRGDTVSDGAMPTLISTDGEKIGVFWEVSYDADNRIFLIVNMYYDDDNIFHLVYYICDAQLDIVLKREDVRIERTEPNTYLVEEEGLFVPGKGFISTVPLWKHLMENVYMLGNRDIVTGDGTLLLSCGNKKLKYEFSHELMDWQIWLGDEEYLLSDLTSGTADAAAPLFSDVHTSDYFFEPVLWALGENITNGTSATTFSPNQTCTRAQILTFLWRAADCPEATTSNPYTDISTSDYYYKAALWAYESGMVNSDKFEANTPCTRGDSITYIWKAAGKPVAETDSGFTDVVGGTECAQAVSWAKKAGVTNGTTRTTFSPSQTCTRAQIITLLYRAYMQ